MLQMKHPHWSFKKRQKKNRKKKKYIYILQVKEKFWSVMY